MRLRVFERDRFACRVCASEDKTLEVHHVYYVSSREPWEYPLSALLTLCTECHKDMTDTGKSVYFTWEHFQAIEEESDRVCGDPGSFISDFCLFCSRHDIPESEMLDLIGRAMLYDVLDDETIKCWRDDLKALRIKSGGVK